MPVLPAENAGLDCDRFYNKPEPNPRGSKLSSISGYNALTAGEAWRSASATWRARSCHFTELELPCAFEKILRCGFTSDPFYDVLNTSFAVVPFYREIVFARWPGFE